MNKINVVENLASSLDRRDEEPNIELAEIIAKTKNKEAVQSLIELLNDKKTIQNDAIKVIYEIGERNPSLIAPHLERILGLLTTKNNRLQWGLMTAINSVVSECGDKIHQALPIILDTAENGSVITRDGAVHILINLSAVNPKKYHNDCMTLLLEQLLQCPTNQLPMYAERILPIVQEVDKQALIESLKNRLDDIEKESKRKRVEKVIKKLEN